MVEDVISYLFWSWASYRRLTTLFFKLVPFRKSISRNFVSCCILCGDKSQTWTGSLMPCGRQTQALVYSKIIFSFKCQVPFLYQLPTSDNTLLHLSLLKALMCVFLFEIRPLGTAEDILNVLECVRYIFATQSQCQNTKISRKILVMFIQAKISQCAVLFSSPKAMVFVISEFTHKETVAKLCLALLIQVLTCDLFH